MNIMLFFVNTSHLIQKSSRSRDQNISLDAILTCPQIDPEYENAHAVYMKKVLSVNQSIQIRHPVQTLHQKYFKLK